MTLLADRFALLYLTIKNLTTQFVIVESHNVQQIRQEVILTLRTSDMLDVTGRQVWLIPIADEYVGVQVKL